MAYNSGKKQENNRNGAGAAQQPNQRPQQPQNNQQQQQQNSQGQGTQRMSQDEQRRSVHEMYSDNKPLIDTVTAGDELAKFNEAVKEKFESVAESIHTRSHGELIARYIPISNSISNMKLDSFMVGLTYVGQKNITVMVSCAIMGQQELPRQDFSYGNANFTYPAIPADIFTDDYVFNVQDYIARTVPQIGTQHILGIVAIPKYFKTTPENAHKLVANLINVIHSSVTESNTDRKGFSLTEDFTNTEIVTGKVRKNSQDRQDIFGTPQRSDMSLMLATQDRNQNGRNQNRNSLEARGSRDLGSISLYPELSYVGSSSGRFGNSRRRGVGNVNDPVYHLGVNITDVNTAGRYNMEFMLLNLSSVAVLIRERLLVESIFPEGEMSYLRRLDSINMDKPDDYPEIMPNPTMEDWLNIASDLVAEDSIHIYIQIPKSAPTSTMLNTFKSAAINNANQASRDEAIGRIASAMVSLTNGQINGANINNIGQMTNRIVLLGEWRDKNNQSRDLRELQDYLTVITYYGTRQDGQVIIDGFLDAMYSQDMPMAERMEILERIVKDISEGECTITDIANIMEINPAWLFDCTAGCEAAGLSIQGDVLDAGQRRRATYNSAYTTGGYSGSLYQARNNRNNYNGY